MIISNLIKNSDLRKIEINTNLFTSEKSSLNNTNT